MNLKNRKIGITDRSILRILQQDSSTPQKQIARILNKSVSTISARIKWLGKNEIMKCTAVIDHRILDLGILGYINLDLDNYSAKTLEEFKLNLDQTAGVCGCISLSGRFKYSIMIAARDTASFSAIEKNIANLNHVRKHESNIVLEELIPYRGYQF